MTDAPLSREAIAEAMRQQIGYPFLSPNEIAVAVLPLVQAATARIPELEAEIERLRADIKFVMETSEITVKSLRARLAAAPDLTELDDVQAQVAEWCKGFREDGADPNPLADALAVVEEAGEVARAVLKRWHGKREGDWNAEVRLEAADTLITLLSLASNEGFSLSSALAERWATVSARIPGAHTAVPSTGTDGGAV